MKQTLLIGILFGRTGVACTKTEIRYVEVSTTRPVIETPTSATSLSTPSPMPLSKELLIAAASCLDSMPIETDWNESSGLINHDNKRNLVECRNFRVLALAERIEPSSSSLSRDVTGDLQKYLNMIEGQVDTEDACTRYATTERRLVDELMCFSNWLLTYPGRLQEYKALSESIISDLNLILE